MNDWAVIIVIYVSLFLASPLIAILHELGHAFAYLILTKPGKIDIYIGTYHEVKNPIQFRAGKLHFFIKRSFPFVKGIGLCRSCKAETNYKNFIIILLAGPVFTFLTAAILGAIVWNMEGYFLLKVSCCIFLGLSALSLIGNLIPRKIARSGAMGLDNDGKQILFSIRAKDTLQIYIEAFEEILKKDFVPAIDKLKGVLKTNPAIADESLRLLIFATISTKQYEDAALYLAKLGEKSELLPNDMVQLGYMQSLTHRHDEAIATYSKVLKKDRNNLIALNNIGCELIEKGAHQVAKQALDKAIKLKPDFAEPYANLGYSKIVQGDLPEGKVLSDKCLSLDPKNVGAHKSLGVYFLKMKSFDLARINFDKAVEFDKDIDLGGYPAELQLLIEQQVAVD